MVVEPGAFGVDAIACGAAFGTAAAAEEGFALFAAALVEDEEA